MKKEKKKEKAVPPDFPKLKFFTFVDKEKVTKAALVLRAVNHKLRQQIIELIEKNERMTVTNLYIKLRLEQSVASQHLAILRRAGIVTTERNGKFIFYKVSEEKAELIDCACNLLLNSEIELE